MTDEEYLRACGWARQDMSSGKPRWQRWAGGRRMSLAEAVEVQLTEDRARHNFMLARSRQNGGFMFARDGAPVNVGEYGIEPGGAPMNASAAAIETLKMQRPVVTVNVAEPLTGKPSPRPSSLSEWAENQGRWVRNWTSMPAGRVAVAVTLDERTGLWTGNGRALFVSPADARDAVDDLLRKQGLL